MTTEQASPTQGNLAVEPEAGINRISGKPDPFASIGLRSRHMPTKRHFGALGPLEKIYLFWFVGASCDGCTIALTAATKPSAEDLMAGTVPGLPRVEVIHTVVSVESGPEWVNNMILAENGELDAPFVICWEGSVMDETKSGTGYWMGLGEDPDTGRTVTSLEWLTRLAPMAAAVIAVGTCATWGGIPAAEGNVTNAMGTMDYLGKDYRSAFGVPVVNIPGCPSETTSPKRPLPSCCSSKDLPRCLSSTSSAVPRGSSARRFIAIAHEPVTTRKVSSPRSMGTKSASSSSAAGAL